MSLILKKDKGFRLNSTDIDNNFIYLSTTTLTYDEMVSLINGGLLSNHKSYLISDRADLGILVESTSNNSLKFDGYGGFLNVDVHNIGSYTQSLVNRGIWSVSSEYITLEYTDKITYELDTTDDLTGVENFMVCSTDDSSGIIIGVINGISLSYLPLSGTFSDVYTSSSIYVSDTGLTYSINSTTALDQIIEVGQIWGDNGSYAMIDSIQDNVLTIKDVVGDFSSSTLYNVVSGSRLVGTISSASTDDVFIWDNNHYAVYDKDAFNGTSPSNNDSAYRLLERITDNGYIEEWDKIVYDLITDTIISRADKRGNYVNALISNFQWGDNNISNVHIEYSSINTLNNTGFITGKSVGVENTINLHNNSGDVFFHITGTNQNIYAPDNSGEIELHLIGFNVGVYSPDNTGGIRSYLYNSSYMNAVNNSGTIHTRHYDSNFAILDNNSGDILDCIFEKQSGDYYISLSQSFSYSGCKFGHGTGEYQFPSEVSYSNKELLANSSSFDTTYDIVETTLDLLNTFAGNIKLDPVEYNSVDKIITNVNFPIKLKAIPGSSISFNFVPVSLVDDDGLLVSTGFSSITLSGDNDDYIVFQVATNSVTPYYFLKAVEIWVFD